MSFVFSCIGTSLFLYTSLSHCDFVPWETLVPFPGESQAYKLPPNTSGISIGFSVRNACLLPWNLLCAQACNTQDVGLNNDLIQQLDAEPTISRL